jgi:hypothetical protein
VRPNSSQTHFFVYTSDPCLVLSNTRPAWTHVRRYLRWNTTDRQCTRDEGAKAVLGTLVDYDTSRWCFAFFCRQRPFQAAAPKAGQCLCCPLRLRWIGQVVMARTLNGLFGKAVWTSAALCSAKAPTTSAFAPPSSRRRRSMGPVPTCWRSGSPDGAIRWHGGRTRLLSAGHSPEGKPEEHKKQLPRYAKSHAAASRVLAVGGAFVATLAR